MKTNMGKIDRILRIAIAAIIVILFFTKQINGTSGIVLLVFGGILLITSFIGSCPLYFPFRINTGKKE